MYIYMGMENLHQKLCTITGHTARAGCMLLCLVQSCMLFVDNIEARVMYNFTVALCCVSLPYVGEAVS